MAEVALMLGTLGTAMGSAAGTAGTALAANAGTIGTVASLVGTGVSAAGGMAAASSQKKISAANAQAQERAGQEQLVAANRKAFERQREARMVASRARAAAADSGTAGGGIADIIGSIEGRGQTAALGDVQQGKAAYSAAKYGAAVEKMSGAAKASQMKTSAYADLIGGLGDVFSQKIKKS